MQGRQIEGVIFDMDGLMIDTEILYQRFWCEAANQLGYPMTAEHVAMIRCMAGKFAAPKLQQIFGSEFDYAAVRKRRQELMDPYVEAHGIEKKKGLDILLTYLRTHHYKLGIATATPPDRTERYLKRIGVYDYFHAIACAPMVPNGKPEPDIYLKAAADLALSPSRCLALEDSANGILAAYRAGCLPVMIPDIDRPDTEIRSLLFDCLEDLSQVIPLLENTENGMHSYDWRKP